MIKIDTKTLAKPLSIVCSAVDRSQVMPSLGSLFVSYGDGKVSMSGSNMEIMLTATVDAETSGEGDVLIPAHKALSIVNSLPKDAKIKIENKQDNVVLSAGRSRFKLGSLPPNGYPMPEEDENTKTIDVSGDAMKGMIGMTRLAQAKNDVRYYLNGTLIELSNESIRAVATDGHRLHVAQTQCATNENMQIIVPRNTVEQIAKLDFDEITRLKISNRSIVIDAGGIRLWSKLIDGKFPDYRRMINVDEDIFCEVDSASLMNALKRCGILAGKNMGVIVCYSKNTMALESKNMDGETAKEEVQCEYSGHDVTIGMNAAYVLDAVESIGALKVKITVNESAMAKIFSVDSDDRFACVMPMRI